jgi:hypothetical protein
MNVPKRYTTSIDASYSPRSKRQKPERRIIYRSSRAVKLCLIALILIEEGSLVLEVV